MNSSWGSAPSFWKSVEDASVKAPPKPWISWYSWDASMSMTTPSSAKGKSAMMGTGSFSSHVCPSLEDSTSLAVEMRSPLGAAPPSAQV